MALIYRKLNNVGLIVFLEPDNMSLAVGISFLYRAYKQTYKLSHIYVRLMSTIFDLLLTRTSDSFTISHISANLVRSVATNSTRSGLRLYLPPLLYLQHFTP